MDRLMRLLTLAAAVAVLAGCGAPKQAVAPPTPAPEQNPFPTPYIPAKDAQIAGRAVGDLAGWTSACVYTEALLTDAQKAWVASLQPAGGEGRVAVGFTEDFDHGGTAKSVVYGAYTKGNGTEGNFVLVTRSGSDKPEVLLLKEIPGPPQFTVFTLKPDGSLWFGGGIDAGEVTMKIVWEDHQPVFSFLSPE
jgi:hypothetical protein